MLLPTEQAPVVPGTLPWARERLRGLIGASADPRRFLGIVHDGPPASKARARWARTSQRAYTPASTRTEEEALAWAFFQGGFPEGPFLGNVAILAVFYRPNHQRIDADNLMKLVLDAGTRAGLWRDDSQITTQGAIVEYDPAHPRTIVVCCDSTSTLAGGLDAQEICRTCGTRFVAAGRQRRGQAKWCSRACRMTLAVPVPCATCRQPFKRRNSKAVHCSNPCRLQALAASHRTHATCRRGHPYEEATTLMMRDGRRRCRICSALVARSRRSRVTPLTGNG